MNLSGLALDGLALLFLLGTYIKRFFELLLYEWRDLAGGTEKTESTTLNKDLVPVRVPKPSVQVVPNEVCDTEDASAVVDPPCRTLVEDHFEVRFSTPISGIIRVV
jgi:hypothetical protein